MQCSHCSERIRPIAVFDIDGVLGDYHGHFENYAEGYLGRKLPTPTYDGSEPHREWFRTRGVDPVEFRAMKLAFRQGSLKRTMPPYRKVIQTVHKAKAKGAEIWLATQRPYLRMDNIDPDTRWWLESNNVPFDYMIYDEVKYQELEARVDNARVVSIVDDTPEMYDDAKSIFGETIPILYQSIYNRGVKRPNEAGGPVELWQTIRDRIESWERMYG